MFYPMLKRLIRSIGVIVMAVAIGLPGHVLGSMPESDGRTSAGCACGCNPV